MNKKILVFLLILMSLFVSCKKTSKKDQIVFDNSYPLALAPDVIWALVTDPYAAYRELMDWHSENNGHVRRGEILQVLGKAEDEDDVTWYKFEEGWLPASCLLIFSNRMKAQTAASQLKD